MTVSEMTWRSSFRCSKFHHVLGSLPIGSTATTGCQSHAVSMTTTTAQPNPASSPL
ncbi:hypothetical protein OYC64_001149 [Pagothenia borchgrevinki]|uniref:Uncharacterized protein n=1 Tax=Pagothenia borchgrevinki TaxID=8213 RepID=A0ABD2G9M4_PAGBO